MSEISGSNPVPTPTMVHVVHLMAAEAALEEETERRQYFERELQIAQAIIAEQARLIKLFLSRG